MPRGPARRRAPFSTSPERSHCPGPPSSWGSRNFCLRPAPPALPISSRPALARLPPGPGRAGAASLWLTGSWPPGTPFVRPPPAQPPLGPGALEAALSSSVRLAEYSMILSILPPFSSPTLGREAPGVPSRVVGQSGLALLVGVAGSRGNNSGGGAWRRFPQERGGETIEREGQRVMAVRGRSDLLLQTTLLAARAGV